MISDALFSISIDWNFHLYSRVYSSKMLAYSEICKALQCCTSSIMHFKKMEIVKETWKFLTLHYSTTSRFTFIIINTFPITCHFLIMYSTYKHTHTHTFMSCITTSTFKKKIFSSSHLWCNFHSAFSCIFKLNISGQWKLMSGWNFYHKKSWSLFLWWWRLL